MANDSTIPCSPRVLGQEERNWRGGNTESKFGEPNMADEDVQMGNLDPNDADEEEAAHDEESTSSDDEGGINADDEEGIDAAEERRAGERRREFHRRVVMDLNRPRDRQLREAADLPPLPMPPGEFQRRGGVIGNEWGAAERRPLLPPRDDEQQPGLGPYQGPEQRLQGLDWGRAPEPRPPRPMLNPPRADPIALGVPNMGNPGQPGPLPHRLGELRPDMVGPDFGGAAARPYMGNPGQSGPLPHRLGELRPDMVGPDFGGAAARPPIRRDLKPPSPLHLRPGEIEQPEFAGAARSVLDKEERDLAREPGRPPRASEPFYGIHHPDLGRAASASSAESPAPAPAVGQQPIRRQVKPPENPFLGNLGEPGQPRVRPRRDPPRAFEPFSGKHGPDLGRAASASASEPPAPLPPGQRISPVIPRPNDDGTASNSSDEDRAED
ncbi:proline-rich protein 2-like [Sycon ciliatum]|uniref:proline-rich protein 2-like n=1 Tax=Sycon ciliatum TaxID=27933 RepID=UPI0031F65E27